MKIDPMKFDSAKHDICAHCNGYGSSLSDPIGTDTCTVCEGSGLVPLKKEVTSEHSTDSCSSPAIP